MNTSLKAKLPHNFQTDKPNVTTSGEPYVKVNYDFYTDPHPEVITQAADFLKATGILDVKGPLTEDDVLGYLDLEHLENIGVDVSLVMKDFSILQNAITHYMRTVPTRGVVHWDCWHAGERFSDFLSLIE